MEFDISFDLPPKLLPTDFVAIDLELFGAEKKKLHRPTTGEFACVSICYKLDLVHIITDKKQVREALDNLQDATWIFHNASFDIKQLRRWTEILPRKKLWDTMVIERIMCGGLYEGDGYSLEAVARRRLDYRMDKKIRDSFESATVLTDEQIRYCAEDSVITWLVCKAQQKEMTKNDFNVWKNIDRGALFALLDFQGFRLNVEGWKELAQRNSERANELAKGFEFNPASPIQVKQTLVKNGFRGLKDTQEPTLQKAMLKYPDKKAVEIAQKVLEYRTFAKRASTYGQKFLDDYLEYNGEDVYSIHAHYWVVGTEHGRTSSSNPNCFSSDTEILTNSGWKLFSELIPDDLVAQIIPTSHQIEFVKPTKYFKYPHNGNLVHIETESVDILATKDHRILSFSRDENQICDVAESWLQKTSSDNKIIDRKFLRAGIRKDGKVLSSQELIELQKAVIVQAEGHITLNGNIIIGLKSKRKQDQCKDIFSDYKFRPSGILITYVYKNDPCLKWLNMDNKTFNISKLLELSYETLDEFLYFIHLWDGDYTRKKTFLQKNIRQDAVDAVRLAAILTGKSTKWYKKGDKYSVINIHNKRIRHASRTTVTEEPYIGNVYCVSVPSEIIIIKRNDKVVACYNCQNIPSRDTDEFRKQFIARPGHKLIVVDMGQQETRIAAYVSQDKALMEVLQDTKQDVFVGMAKMIYKKDITKDDPFRKQVKNTAYGINYGMSAEGMADRYGMTLAEAEEAIHLYFKTFSGFHGWVMQQRQKTNYVETIAGRRVWLNPYSTQCERNALNDPISGSAADQMKIALGNIHQKWHDEIPEVFGFPCVGYIHDELIFDVPAMYAEKVAKFVQREMISAAEIMCPGVPFTATPKICDNWAEGK